MIENHEDYERNIKIFKINLKTLDQSFQTNKELHESVRKLNELIAHEIVEYVIKQGS